MLRGTRITLFLAALLALCLVGFSALEGYAGPWTPRGYAGFVRPEPIATPVKVWRDCQEIALCSGCRPVYKCRSCEYKRTCSGGLCSWGDVCVWGAYVKVLPPGARIIRAR